MFGFDPLYLMFALPGFLLAMWAQYATKSTFERYAQVGTRAGYTGEEIARRILAQAGVSGVRIEPVQGFLSDHYDPTTRTLRLSPDVFGGRSISATGVAAHEVGHAIQHARSYPFLRMRSALVPVLQITSQAAMPMLMVGFLLASAGVSFGIWVAQLGALLFAGVFVFQLVTLPVEFDASARALAAIDAGQLLTPSEQTGAARVLRAAALTYVAAAVQSGLTLLYYLWRTGLIGGRRERD